MIKPCWSSLKPGKALVSRATAWDQLTPCEILDWGLMCGRGNGWEHRRKGGRKWEKRGQEGEVEELGENEKNSTILRQLIFF